jgi:hypothetical protein
VAQRFFLGKKFKKLTKNLSKPWGAGKFPLTFNLTCSEVFVQPLFKKHFWACRSGRKLLGGGVKMTRGRGRISYAPQKELPGAKAGGRRESRMAGEAL